MSKVFEYDMLIARLEPENSIEVILDGVAAATTERIFLVIGNHQTPYGNYITSKYAKNQNIKFIGGIYDIEKLNNLRFFSNIYFHGHTVGGTNPSLLEAMASNALICANNNEFNKCILGNDALYFDDSTDVSNLLVADKQQIRSIEMLEANKGKIHDTYSWDTIVEQYAAHFIEIGKKSLIATERVVRVLKVL